MNPVDYDPPQSPLRQATRYQHVQERLKERYKLELSYEDLWEISEMCKFGEGESCGRASNGEGDVWLVSYKGNKLKVVYSAQTDALVTVLPMKGK